MTKKRKPYVVLLVGLMALMLMFGGCSCKEGQSTWDCLKEKVGTIVEQVCGFNSAESQVAQDGINFISTVAPMVGTIFGVSISSAQAKATLTKVVDLAAKGGCMAMEDLQQALNFVDKLTSQYEEMVNAAKFKGIKTLPSPPDMHILRHKAKMK